MLEVQLYPGGAIGSVITSGTTGVELNFQHALTEISVAAKNSNTAYTVKVTEMCIRDR